MRVTVILNERAGALAQPGNGSSWTLDALRSALTDAGIDAEVRLTRPGGVSEAVREALSARNGYEAIVVGGGDGTLGCAAGVLADSALPMGVLPLGTLNHFAKDLGLPTDLAGCVNVLARGQTRCVDIAEVNGRPFINNCSIGAYPEAVRRRDALRRQHGLGKWRAMLVASLEVLKKLRRLRVSIEIPNEILIRRTPFVIVANNRYSGQILSRQLRPRLDEGTLCTYVTRAHRVAPLLRLAWRTMTAGIDAAEQLETRDAPELTVTLQETDPAIATDGEVFQVRSPLRFRVRPRALRVLAPVAANS